MGALALGCIGREAHHPNFHITAQASHCCPSLLMRSERRWILSFAGCILGRDLCGLFGLSLREAGGGDRS